jgi:predicted CXXCH cytochrome family protein
MPTADGQRDSIVMRGLKSRYSKAFRYGPALVGLAMFVYVVAFVTGCDEVERHKVLTYFFDGVPPPGQDQSEAGPFDPNAQPVNQAGQTPGWYVHKPQEDCTNCHRKRASRGFSAETYLIASVPRLCYKCHEDYTANASYVHGPVADGRCLFCHNPHRSRIKHLLTRPEPELCFLCHDQTTIESIPAHLPEQTSACTDCHDPHAGSTKALLKSPSATGQPETEKPNDAPSAGEPSMTPEQREQLSKEQREIAELYYRSMEYYRKGKLKRAKEGLVKVLNSGLVPAPMADTIRAHIADIENRLAKGTDSAETSP